MANPLGYTQICKDNWHNRRCRKDPEYKEWLLTKTQKHLANDITYNYHDNNDTDCIVLITQVLEKINPLHTLKVLNT